MIERRLTSKLKKSLERSPCVALLGPRQVGKTTLALQFGAQMPSLYLDLENRLDLLKVGDFKNFFTENKDQLIILDEVHRLPELFAEVRGIVDEERRAGRKNGLFLFLGSASIELLKQSSESLAGRIAWLELTPVDALEYASYAPGKLRTHWFRGGFPESLLAGSEENSMEWRNDFIRTYLERDIPQLGPRIPAETIGRFWTMLAYQQGSILNAAELARSMGVKGVTIARYLDLMVDLMLVRLLRPWVTNTGKRLVRSPKVYVRDSGLTHALLNLNNFNSLIGHPVSGGSWEGFVVENIASVLPAMAQIYFYRSSGGAEIDLVIEFAPDKRWAVEIKLSSAPTLEKGFFIACEEIKASQKFVIYNGNDRFSMQNGVTAIPLITFMELVLSGTND
jgi:predicted AAA+ superfamily ATPase